jgi:ribonuclease HI
MDATADGVTAVVHADHGRLVAAGGPEQLAEPGTKVPRRGLTRNRALGRGVPVAVEALERADETQPWQVRVSMDGQAWVERVEARYSRDEAVEAAWRDLCLRAAALLPPQEG